jgi:hypothetical protein
MNKKKRKRTAAEKRERARRQAQFMTVFVRGKQKRVPRPQTIDGMSPDEFTAANADPIWLHQNEMWELMQDCTECVPTAGGGVNPLEDRPMATRTSDRRALPALLAAGHLQE